MKRLTDDVARSGQFDLDKSLYAVARFSYKNCFAD